VKRSNHPRGSGTSFRWTSRRGRCGWRGYNRAD
jgi:hypothetical protein